MVSEGILPLGQSQHKASWETDLPIVEDPVSACFTLCDVKIGTQYGNYKIGKVPLQPFDSHPLVMLSLVGWNLSCSRIHDLTALHHEQSKNIEPLHATRKSTLDHKVGMDHIQAE